MCISVRSTPVRTMTPQRAFGPRSDDKANLTEQGWANYASRLRCVDGRMPQAFAVTVKEFSPTLLRDLVLVNRHGKA
jgi:hypothetical protein